jgi:hypothetical protein
VSAPWLIVVHRPVGSYEGTLEWLRDPRSKASAHVVTEGFNRATQLVQWHRKAWTCAAFNSASYNVEVDDDAWDGTDPDALATAARIVAFLCKRTGIPPSWTRQPTHTPGVCRHLDLGRAGGGHTDPTTDETLWRGFVAMVRSEHERGGFRPTWGVGTLARIDT